MSDDGAQGPSVPDAGGKDSTEATVSLILELIGDRGVGLAVMDVPAGPGQVARVLVHVGPSLDPSKRHAVPIAVLTRPDSVPRLLQALAACGVQPEVERKTRGGIILN